MKKNLGAFLVVLMAVFTVLYTNVCAQSSNREISLKAYTKAIREKNNGNSIISLGSVSTAWAITSNTSYFHEFELTAYSSRSFDTETKNIVAKFPTKAFGLGYSFNYKVAGNTKAKFYLGAGVQSKIPFTTRYTSENKSSSAISLDYYVAPRFTWDINSKFYLDINVPVSIATSTWNNKLASPDKVINSGVFPNKYTVNVGVGFKF